VVFDTNRLWCSKLPALAALFPPAKIICCVRHVPWILDSIERLIRQNRFEPSKIFNFEPAARSIPASRPGFRFRHGGFRLECATRSVLRRAIRPHAAVDYETLTSEPRRALAAVYDFIGESPFEHDFANLAFDATDFDARLGTPGCIAGQVVQAHERRTSCRPTCSAAWTGFFWRDPAQNPRGVTVV